MHTYLRAALTHCLDRNQPDEDVGSGIVMVSKETVSPRVLQEHDVKVKLFQTLTQQCLESQNATKREKGGEVTLQPEQSLSYKQKVKLKGELHISCIQSVNVPCILLHTCECAYCVYRQYNYKLQFYSKY